MFQNRAPNIPSYRLPKDGLLSFLPHNWVPYAELIRIHKPAGILYIYFPYLFGTLLAAILTNPIPAPRQLLETNVFLFVVAFIVRSIGCSWNDNVDRQLDRYVARCRSRPIARGAITPNQGDIFTGCQYIILFSFVASISPRTLPYLVPTIITGTFYPYAKRITNYAQLVLGISLSLGTLPGYSITGSTPLSLDLVTGPPIALVTLSVSYVVWTMVYDTIYAFQDIRDDERAGIKAMSVQHESHMKPLLFGLSILQVGLLIITGLLIGAGPPFFAGLASTAILLLCMVRSINLEEPEACWWWFKYGGLLVGGSLTISLQGEYLARLWMFGH